MVSSILLVVTVFAVLPWLSQSQTPSTKTFIWKKVNVWPICFEGQGKKPGDVLNLGKDMLVGAMKLVHTTGQISCVQKTAYFSKWGCYHINDDRMNYPLNVIVTDNYNHIIYPLQSYYAKSSYSAGLWYYLPFIDSLNSKELVFSNFCDPLYFPQHSSLKIWYGEDLRSWNQGDNIGRVCVDVYVHEI